MNNIYFIGIGGIGMSALARYYHSKGVRVSGYDKTQSSLTAELEKEGMAIHFEENLDLISRNAEMVVYTPALQPISLNPMQTVLSKPRAEFMRSATTATDFVSITNSPGTRYICAILRSIAASRQMQSSWSSWQTAAIAIFGFGIRRVGIGLTGTESTRRFTGTRRTVNGFISRLAVCGNCQWNRLFVTFLFTKRRHLPNGKTCVCQRNSNGKRQATGSIGGNVGNGQEAPICHIPVSKNQPERLANIMENL